jgi:CRISPR-associated protein Cas5h
VELFDSNLHNLLKTKLVNHECVYTPTLGLSENLANFLWIGDLEYTEKSGSPFLQSVIPLKGLKNTNIEFENEKEYFTDTFAMEMQEDRIVTEYCMVLFERNGKPIKTKSINYLSIENGDRIVWL